MNSKLIQIIPRMVRGVLVVISIALLVACASHRIIEHGIKYEVKGTQAINDLEVLYGKEVITFNGIRPPGSGAGWNAPMSVPKEMTVNWTVNGIRQQVTIPLSDKTSNTYLLKNWRWKFDGTDLELWREEQTGPTNPTTGLQPRHKIKVFP